jgi:ribosomal-protein-alanine N-acetyltransferase
MFEAEFDGNPFGCITVAVADDAEGGDAEPIGYVCYWVVFEELRILNLAVAPAFRKRGIGLRLARHALDAGRARGARSADLEVRASNQAARGLYERLGFRQTGVRRRYYVDPTEDAVLMELDMGRTRDEAPVG